MSNFASFFEMDFLKLNILVMQLVLVLILIIVAIFIIVMLLTFVFHVLVFNSRFLVPLATLDSHQIVTDESVLFT